MGNKRQAEASAAFAKIMKEMGIRRHTARCPVNHRHTYSLRRGLSDHFTRCKG